MDDVWGIFTTHSWINFNHSIVGLLSLECGIPRLTYATPAAMYSVFPDPPEPWRGRRLGTAEAVPHESFEETYPRYPFAALVGFGLAFAGLVARAPAKQPPARGAATNALPGGPPF